MEANKRWSAKLLHYDYGVPIYECIEMIIYTSVCEYFERERGNSYRLLYSLLVVATWYIPSALWLCAWGEKTAERTFRIFEVFLVLGLQSFAEDGVEVEKAVEVEETGVTSEMNVIFVSVVR